MEVAFMLHFLSLLFLWIAEVERYVFTMHCAVFGEAPDFMPECFQ